MFHTIPKSKRNLERETFFLLFFCFFFLHKKETHQDFFFFCAQKFAQKFLFSTKIMGDIKEFTNEERSLLKFQKKQQHGQVVL